MELLHQMILVEQTIHLRNSFSADLTPFLSHKDPQNPLCFLWSRQQRYSCNSESLIRKVVTVVILAFRQVWTMTEANSACYQFFDIAIHSS